MHLRKSVSHFPPPFQSLPSYEKVSIDLQQNMCLLILFYMCLVECYILKSRSGLTKNKTNKKQVINMSRFFFYSVLSVQKLWMFNFWNVRKYLNPTFSIDRKLKFSFLNDIFSLTRRIPVNGSRLWMHFRSQCTDWWSKNNLRMRRSNILSHSFLLSRQSVGRLNWHPAMISQVRCKTFQSPRRKFIVNNINY